MNDWERQMALRGLPPSSSHRGWNFYPHKPTFRFPIGYGLVAVVAFSALVWAAIMFKH